MTANSRRNRTPVSGATWVALILVLVIPGPLRAEDDEIDFQLEIRPLLSDFCFQCHGPDSTERKADLRLDIRAGAESVLTPGDAEGSELYRRITATDPDDRMPPPESGKVLKPEDVAKLERWIKAGAPWKDHWSFEAPVRPERPTVEQKDWPQNEIDYFVLARLEAAGLSPSPRADRRTLIRRLSFDIRGLPPSLEEVREFVEDDSPSAVERVVDRFLRSPHYGEHMARFWLDAARYGDTHGLHLDNLRIMWPYRDWVIDAFNRNMPFDQFTIEQLAGDLLPEPTEAQLIATGFNRCNVTTSEGGSIDEEYYVRYAVDRVETTATVWMGLTAGCAVCHEHKFDPISQKEFYQLFAFFNNITERAMDGNQPAPPPVLDVPLPGVPEQREEITAQIDRVEARLEERSRQVEAEFDAWLVEASADSRRRDVPAGLLAHYTLDEAGVGVCNSLEKSQQGSVQGDGAFVEGHVDGAFEVRSGSYVDLGDVGDFEGNRPFSYGAWITTTGKVDGAPLARMHPGERHRGWDLYVNQRKLAAHLIHSWSDFAIKVTTKADVLEPGKWHHVFATYDGSGKAAGLKLYVDGKERPLDVNVDSLQGKTIRTTTAFYVGMRRTGSHFTGGRVDDARIFNRALSPEEVATLAGTDAITPLLAKEASARSDEEISTLREHFTRTVDPKGKTLAAKLDDLRARDSVLAGQKATTLIMQERDKPRGAFRLERGQYDQRREPVEPATPAALPSMPDGAPRNRLGLAKWLVDPAHPLTSRVAVNRLWQSIFGTGIVKTAEDFGSQGEPPSHPRLLDWLAVEYRESGWDTKRLQKMIFLSATYQQSSALTPDRLEKDPANRLLSRGSRFRLDAEVLRDQALELSGLLVKRIGGPSVKPPQPNGLWYAVAYTSSNTAHFKADSGEDIYRRSVYTFWKRTAPPPVMATFDAPSREQCTVRRERTNTPLQALVLMNEQQYFEAARHFAARGLRRGGSPEEIAAYLFELATARKPDSIEIAELVGAYRDHLEFYRNDAEAARAVLANGATPTDMEVGPAEIAAWTLVGNLILNLDEVVTKG